MNQPETELWRPVPGFEGLFSVSGAGMVYSHRARRSLAVQRTARGYLKTSLSADGKKRDFLVHRLVALAWVDNPDNKLQVNHKNGVKTDNHFANLEWATNSENGRHAWAMGLSKTTEARRGNGAKSALVTAKVPAELRPEVERLDRTGVRQKDIAKRFGISQSSVSRIVKHVRSQLREIA